MNQKDKTGIFRSRIVKWGLIMIVLTCFSTPAWAFIINTIGEPFICLNGNSSHQEITYDGLRYIQGLSDGEKDRLATNSKNPDISQGLHQHFCVQTDDEWCWHKPKDMYATLLNNAYNMTGTGNVDGTYDSLGRLLHLTEDFYAHTNWVDNHNQEEHFDFDGEYPSDIHTILFWDWRYERYRIEVVFDFTSAYPEYNYPNPDNKRIPDIYFIHKPDSNELWERFPGLDCLNGDDADKKRQAVYCATEEVSIQFQAYLKKAYSLWGNNAEATVNNIFPGVKDLWPEMQLGMYLAEYNFMYFYWNNFSNEPIEIQVLKDGVLLGNIATVSSSTISYKWNLKDKLSNGHPIIPGTGYQIRLKRLNGTKTNEGPCFEIKTTYILAPEYNAQWQRGDIKKITIQSRYDESSMLTGTYNVKLWKENELLGSIGTFEIASGANTYYFDWVVGTHDNGQAEIGNGYWIQLIHLLSDDDPIPYIEYRSDTFSIVEPTGLPDVVMEDVWLEPADFSPGQNVNVMARIKNQGGAATPSGIQVAAGFRVDGNILGAFFVRTNWVDRTLAAGESYTAACEAQWTATAGTHNFWVKADDVNRFPESNDDNNILEKSFGTPLPEVVITATAGVGGTIEPLGFVARTQGTDQTFTITPDPGYGIQSVTVDGDDVTAYVMSHNNQYPFIKLQIDHTIAATFAPLPTYTITPTAGAGGTIDPSEVRTVTQGTNQTFTITPDPGYGIQSVTVDGDNQGAITSYTFYNVQNNHTIAAIFAQLPIYTITATADTGGTISPPGSVPVIQGNNQTFRIDPDTGYGIQLVMADTDDVTNYVKTHGNQYPFNNVQNNHTIAATFALVPTYTIAATAGAGGTINPMSATVTEGGNQTFTITANSGYAVYSVTVDGENQGVRTSYTFEDVQTNHTIAATFALALTPPSYTGAMYWLDGFGLESGWNTAEHPRMTADVNGDGKADIVGFFNDGVYVALATGTGFTPAQSWIANFDGNNGWWIGWHIRTMADVNGDGKADIVGFGNVGVYVSLSTGTSFSEAQYWSSSFGIWAQSGGWELDKHPRYMADVNGDGKLDVVGFGNDGVYVALSTGSAFTSPQKWVNGFGINDGWSVSNHPRLMADVNGDGKADVVGFGIPGVIVALSNGSGFTAPAEWVGNFGVNQGWSSQHPRVLADINGDGKKDVVGFFNDGVYVSLSTGTGFTPIQKWVEGYGSDGGWDWNKPRFLADANGDGRADVIGFGTDGVRVSLSTGTGFMNSVQVVNNFGTDANWGENFYPRIVADITGDGKADVVGFGGYGVWVSLSTTSAQLPVYSITATAGAGGTINPSGSVVVTQGTNQTFTIAGNSGYAVQSVTVDGVNQGAITSYTFNNIQTDHTIAVTFIPAITYTITATAGAGGTISPSGSVSILKGANASFSIQPVSAAYRISQILLDGSAVAITNDSGQTVPINNIQSNHTVSAIFVIRTFTVTIINEDYSAGYLDPAAGTHTVNYGSNLTIHTVPYSRFTWRDATIDGVFSNLYEYYTFSNITSNHTYFVRFIEK